MSNKEKYHQLLAVQDLPVYLTADWLDATKGPSCDWDVIFSYNDKNEVLGFWVYVFKKQLFWTKITMPPFTPYMGPRLFYPEGLNEYERISFENKVIEDLIQQLPDFAEVKLKWSRGYNNWLSFYWKSYCQQTAYTYVIEDTRDIDFVFKNFKNSTQRQIRKAESNLIVTQTHEVNVAIKMLKLSLKNKAEHLVNEQLLKDIHQVASLQQKCIVLQAQDKNESLLAAIYLVWDKEEMLYLYGGYDDKYNDSGAMTLLFWEALKLAHQKQLSFNFEGSMLKGVERFFRSFGAIQKPVFTLSKSKFPYNFINAFR